MPAWLIPALKAVLPHVGTIVTAAAPVFTRKKADAQPEDALLLQRQIAELQTAVSANDAHIKELAAQIKTTVEAMEKGISQAEARHRTVFALATLAVVLSGMALGIALTAN